MGGSSISNRTELEARQLERLRELLSELGSGNPFYAPRLRAAGLGGELASLAEFRARMPFTTKADLVEDQSANPPYGTNLTFPRERYVRLHQTSSTTGRPLRWLDTRESWSWMRGSWRTVLRSAGITAEDRLLFAFSFGPFIGFWLGFEAAQELGALCIPGGPTGSEARLEIMRANAVTVLCCTPTYAVRLGELARDMEAGAGIALRAIVVGGEPGGCVPATRARIEALWPGARVFDHYGMTEIGPVTFQALADPPDVVRLIESDVLVEIIDPATGEPLTPGTDALGELVLTSFGRVGSPLLRYRTGDLVRPLPATEDDPSRRLAGGILARADQMLVVRGVNVFPSAVEDVVRGFADVVEHRVEVDRSGTMIELRLTIEPAPACADTASLCNELECALRKAFSLRIPVRHVSSGELPRFDLKARRWIDEHGD